MTRSGASQSSIAGRAGKLEVVCQADVALAAGRAQTAMTQCLTKTTTVSTRSSRMNDDTGGAVLAAVEAAGLA